MIFFLISPQELEFWRATDNGRAYDPLVQFDDSIEFQSNFNLRESLVYFINSISSSLPHGERTPPHEKKKKQTNNNNNKNSGVADPLPGVY